MTNSEGDEGGPQRGERRNGRRGIVDTSFNSPIGGERVLSRVHTSDLERQETVEKRIEVSNVRQVPNDVLAQADGADTLYYVSKRDYVPQNWTSFAQRADSRYKEQSESILERLNDTYRNQVWPDDLTKASRTWTGDEDVDDAVKNWVDDVINEMDPLHDQYDGVPALASLTVQKVIRKSLTQPQGWSVRSVAQNLQDEFDWMERDQAENIARQEVAAVLNTSKSVMFRAAEKQDEQYLYDWVGPDDSSTSHICEEIKERIEEKGGKVSFDVLEDTIYNVAEKYRNDGGTPHRAEELVPHYNCRYTVERVQ